VIAHSAVKTEATPLTVAVIKTVFGFPNEVEVVYCSTIALNGVTHFASLYRVLGFLEIHKHQTQVGNILHSLLNNIE
jgi:hypothetical protein